MPRILVVDDQSHVRAAIELALRSKGFDAVAVESGEAGLKELQASKFDLAIVDIYMPGIDGVKLIKAIRADDPCMPVIAMSGVPISTSGRTALDLFPLDPNLSRVVRLQKPFRSPELFQAILKA